MPIYLPVGQLILATTLRRQSSPLGNDKGFGAG